MSTLEEVHPVTPVRRLTIREDDTVRSLIDDGVFVTKGLEGKVTGTIAPPHGTDGPRKVTVAWANDTESRALVDDVEKVV